jgi:hypothetical protein
MARPTVAINRCTTYGVRFVLYRHAGGVMSRAVAPLRVATDGVVWPGQHVRRHVDVRCAGSAAWQRQRRDLHDRELQLCDSRHILARRLRAETQS